MENNNLSVGRLRFSINRKKNEEAIAILNKFGVNSFVENIGSALSIACMSENWEIAKFCIENGADVNLRDCENGTPLIDACKYGNDDIITLLIEAGADINIKNKYSSTPLAELTLRHPEKNDIIIFLLKNGANPNEEIHDGETIYDSAMRMNLLNTIELFDDFFLEK